MHSALQISRMPDKTRAEEDVAQTWSWTEKA